MSVFSSISISHLPPDISLIFSDSISLWIYRSMYPSIYQSIYPSVYLSRLYLVKSHCASAAHSINCIVSPCFAIVWLLPEPTQGFCTRKLYNYIMRGRYMSLIVHEYGSHSTCIICYILYILYLILYYIILYYTIVYYSILYYIVLYYIVYIKLYHIILYYIILYGLFPQSLG